MLVLWVSSHKSEEQIEKLFDGKVRAILPLLETEVRGVHMLERMSTLLFDKAVMPK